MSKRKILELRQWLDDTREARMVAYDLEEQIKEGFWN